MSFILKFFFPHGLILPVFGIVGDTGGSSGSLAGGITATAAPVSPVAAITGDTANLSTNTVRFNVGVTTNLPASGHLDIYNHSSARMICNGRQSAQIVGPLSVQVTLAPADAAAAVTLLSGWVAVMPEARGSQAYPDTVERIAVLPGAIALTVSPLVSGTGVLQIPPGVRNDMIIQQVIGRDPILVFAFSSANVRSITLIVSGNVALSGIGYWDGFF
jgi:hypothetical protein